jgi:uncharacterized protein involved in exopolysaccharide biosynthesis
MSSLPRAKDITNYILFVILKRRLMLAVAGVATAVSILFITSLTTPSWEATTKVLIERNSTHDLGIFNNIHKPAGSAAAPDKDALNMMILMSGENMAYQIVNEFGLDKRLRMKRLKPRNFRQWSKNRLVDLAMIPKYLLQSLGIVSRNEKNWADAAAENFINNQQDIGIESESNVISITIRADTRELAVNIGNRMVELLKERTSGFSREAAAESYAFVKSQIAVAEKNLIETQEDVARYRNNNAIIKIEEEKVLKIARIDAMEAELDDTAKRIEETTFRLAQVTQEMGKLDEKIILSSIIARNPLVTRLESKLEDLEIELASKLPYLSEMDPEIKIPMAKIDRIRSTLLETVESITESRTESINPLYQSLLTRSINLKIDDIALNAREKAINKALINLNKDIKSIPQREFELARLEEILKVNSHVYKTLNTKLGELKVEMKSIVSEYGIRALDRAYLSRNARMASPNWIVSILAAIFCGVIFGLGWVFTVEFFNDSIKSAIKINTLMNAPCLGVFPDLTKLQGIPEATLIEDEL